MEVGIPFRRVLQGLSETPLAEMLVLTIKIFETYFESRINRSGFWTRCEVEGKARAKMNS